MAYVKTIWTEEVPITADRLNNMETGIGNALEKTGGTVTGFLEFANERGVKLKDASGNSRNGLMHSANLIRVGDNTYPLALQSSENPQVKVDNTFYKLYHTGYKPSASDVGALPTNHQSAPFGYNGSTGRITHGGNDVKVLNSVNAENSTKIGGKQIRVGSYTAGASGYITFGY